jgi:hypothetical protein
MAIEKAMWAHGHSMIVEYPQNIKSEWRAGFYIRLVGKRNTTNWFHFAIPTPVIVDNNRLSIDSAMLRFRVKHTLTSVTAVHVYDGEKKIANYNGLNVSPSSFGLNRYNVPGSPDVRWGIGISVGIRFLGANDTQNTVEFASAGVDFEP